MVNITLTEFLVAEACLASGYNPRGVSCLVSRLYDRKEQGGNKADYSGEDNQ